MPCGLFVDQNLNFLAASPDGLINNDGIVEIKCPSSIKHTTPQEATNLNIIKYLIFNKNENIELKRTFPYYFQIQRQLHITQRQYCYFIVWTPNGMFALYSIMIFITIKIFKFSY